MFQPFSALLTLFSSVLVRLYLVYVYIFHIFCKFSVPLRLSNTNENSNNYQNAKHIKAAAY